MVEFSEKNSPRIVTLNGSALTVTSSGTTSASMEEVGFAILLNASLTWIRPAPAFPVFPVAHNLVGSIPTPYIFDDHVNYEFVSDQLHEIYQMGREERKRRGVEGRKYMMGNDSGMTKAEMSRRFMDYMDTVLEKWTSRHPYKLFSI